MLEPGCKITEGVARVNLRRAVRAKALHFCNDSACVASAGGAEHVSLSFPVAAKVRQLCLEQLQLPLRLHGSCKHAQPFAALCMSHATSATTWEESHTVPACARVRADSLLKWLRCCTAAQGHAAMTQYPRARCRGLLSSPSPLSPRPAFPSVPVASGFPRAPASSLR